MFSHSHRCGKQPSLTLLLFLLPLIATLISASSRPVCTLHTTFPHSSISIPFLSAPTLVQVPLTLYYRCTLRDRTPLPSRRRALLLLLPGALGRSKDYSTLSLVLARRGFVVAVPQYDSRDFYSNPALAFVQTHINQTLADGFDCPPLGQLISTKMIASALAFLAGNQLPRNLRALYDVRNVLIFAHSASGVLAYNLFNNICDPIQSAKQPPPSEPFSPALTAEYILRIQCERYSPMDLPRSMHIRGIVAFEGFSLNSDVKATAQRFAVHIYSPFSQSLVDQRFADADFEGKVALVRIDAANHYGPVNFVEENVNQRPVCMLERQPPEDAFVTTSARQRRVLRSVAAVVVAADGGLERLEALLPKRHLEVENVTFV